MTTDNVLVMAPHPDDETMGCGGAILRHLAAGDKVKVIFVTSGGRGKPGAELDPKLASRREKEARAAMTVLGVKDLQFWRELDGSVQVTPQLARKYANVLARFKPYMVYAPSKYETHSDHIAVTQLVEMLPANMVLKYYEVWNALPHATSFVELGDAEQKAKYRALNCYESAIENGINIDNFMGLGRYRAFCYGHVLVGGATYMEAFGK